MKKLNLTLVMIVASLWGNPSKSGLIGDSLGPENIFGVENTRCEVQMITGLCGDGRVKIEFSMDRFTLHHGDTVCWFSPFDLKGKMKNPMGDHSRTARQVDLVVDHDGKELSIGTFTFRKKGRLYPESPALGTLNLKNFPPLGSFGAGQKSYHLRCNNLFGQIGDPVREHFDACERNCRRASKGSERDYLNCFMTCGGW